MPETPLLSVCLITYNHAQFIRQAIDGVLMQKVDFPWEFIIADDCSTDGTREILLEYQKHQPDRIRLILQDTNVGPYKNWLMLMSAPAGRYVAYFEGDDYWTDQRKLEKQILFLEAHPEYVLCFTRGVIHNTLTNSKVLVPPLAESVDVSLSDFITSNSQLTATCMYRRLSSVERLPDYTSEFPFGDLFLYIWLLHTTGLKARCLSDITAVYRIHAAGIYGSLRQSTETLIRAHNQHLEFYSLLRRHVLTAAHDHEISLAMVKHHRSLSQLYVEASQYRHAVSSLVSLFRCSGSARAVGSTAYAIVRTLIGADVARSAVGPGSSEKAV